MPSVRASQGINKRGKPKEHSIWYSRTTYRKMGHHLDSLCLHTHLPYNGCTVIVQVLLRLK